MKAAKVNPHPDAVFGGDQPVTVTGNVAPLGFAGIVEQIKATQARALTPSQQDDFLTMIEFVRDESLKLYETTKERVDRLDARERELTKRERELAHKVRVVGAALQTREITVRARLMGYFGR